MKRFKSAGQAQRFLSAHGQVANLFHRPANGGLASQSLGVTLNPAKDRARVDQDAALLHHLSQIAVADAILAVPGHAQQDNLNGKAAALEQRQQGGSSTGRIPLNRQS
jgi:hypothetical protein